MTDLSGELRTTVEAAKTRLLEISEHQSEIRPTPNEWSAKEILGHLIDSATHNHRRFIEAQWKDDLLFPAYDQEQWVAVQDYQSASWTQLIQLWQSYNLHLAHVIDQVPLNVLAMPRKEHNLDRLPGQTSKHGVAVSLEDLIRHYIGHLQDHLQQIFSI